MIFVTGDTHSYTDIQKLGSKGFPHNKDLTKDDYVIIAGDFGLVWDNGKDEKYWLNWLHQKNFTTLFIDGNHENFNLLESYPVEIWSGGKVHRINPSVIHLTRGQVFMIDGIKFFTFGGAQSTDKGSRIDGRTWWKQEMPSQIECDEGLNNLENHNWKVDFVITHTCPTETLNQLNLMSQRNSKPDQLNDYLDLVQKKLAYKHWYFGHFHQDIELANGQTLVFNKIFPLDF